MIQVSGKAAGPHTRARHKIHATAVSPVSEDTPPAGLLADHPAILIIDFPRDLARRSANLSFVNISLWKSLHCDFARVSPRSDMHREIWDLPHRIYRRRRSIGHVLDRLRAVFRMSHVGCDLIATSVDRRDPWVIVLGVPRS